MTRISKRKTPYYDGGTFCFPYLLGSIDKENKQHLRHLNWE